MRRFGGVRESPTGDERELPAEILSATKDLPKAMAEREGFEPPIRFPVYTLSRRAVSTTHPSLRVGM